MKKIFILLLLLTPIFWFTYQQQGFSQYQENGWFIKFSCESQCIMLIWNTDEYDTINLKGNINGQWVLWYGFLIWQQVAPWITMQINWNWIIDETFILKEAPIFKQLPTNSQIVIIMQGNMNWNIKPSLDVLGLGQKILIGWKDFRKMEPLTPYSINLRYWVKLLWTSILQYGYWFFILIAAYILIFSKDKKKEKYQKIFFWGIGIFLFIGIRNFITDSRIVNQWLKDFTYQERNKKSYFDLWDYITFTDKIRNKLNLQNPKTSCKIQANSFQDWPFTAHREFLYLKPCILVKTGSEADYIIYYKKQISEEDLQKQIILNFNWSYLLKNK